MKIRRVFAVFSVFVLVSCSAAKESASLSAGANFKAAAKFQDRWKTADEVELDAQGVGVPPSGQIDQAWLLGGEGKDVLNLGALPVSTDGSVAFVWDSPNQENLLLRYDRFEVTREPSEGSPRPSGPVVMDGKVGDLGFSLFGPKGKSPSPPAPGLKQQMDLALQHAGMAQAAFQIGAWDEMEAHLEHVVNILDGKDGPHFGDYLGTGVPQNPGDGYGVRFYARDVLTFVGSDFGFPDALKKAEDVCLVLLKSKNRTDDAKLFPELQSALKSLNDGSVLPLYRAAQKSLAFDLDPRS